MIPTMILFGVVFGRWPLAALAAAAVLWPALLVATSVMGIERGLFAGAALSVVNTAAGVVVHQVVLLVVRWLRRQAGAGFTLGP